MSVKLRADSDSLAGQPPVAALLPRDRRPGRCPVVGRLLSHQVGRPLLTGAVSCPMRECLSIILNEEWDHRLYAERAWTPWKRGVVAVYAWSGCGIARTSSSSIPAKSSGLQVYSGTPSAIAAAAINAS